MNSKPVTECQICGWKSLESIFFVGYLPPVNTLRKVTERPCEEPFFPAELLSCRGCGLVQLGTVVDREILFPPCYSYTSGVTKMLRDDFADLCREVQEFGYGKAGDTVVDIGSNDGTLLEFFDNVGFVVAGIEPTDAANIAQVKGILTYKGFLNSSIKWKAHVITACNVFAHMPDVHEAMKCVLEMLTQDGVFIVEVQHLSSLQYDTVYHEHLRYYSLSSLAKLFEMYGMEIIKVKKIPTHGGSVRVYAARKGVYCPFTAWAEGVIVKSFAPQFLNNKLDLLALLHSLIPPTNTEARIYGIGAPSRAVTLIHYVGLGGILDCVCEVSQSKKIGHWIPGTMIPIVDEVKLYEDQPEYAMLLSWHLADELIPKIRAKGFKGKFILPLPIPQVIE